MEVENRDSRRLGGTSDGAQGFIVERMYPTHTSKSRKKDNPNIFQSQFEGESGKRTLRPLRELATLWREVARSALVVSSKLVMVRRKLP